jgi:hypothetical protein
MSVPERDPVLMWCEDGHTWINQGDGTVSPSWGLGGTHMRVADPLLCPEPALGGGARGVDGAEADGATNREPACLKPALGGNAWSDRDRPFDGTRWCAWWVREATGGAWHLTFHQGQESRLWAATYRCLDVRTGACLEVDRTWHVRRASLAEYPAYLRERWWTTPKGTLIGCWSTMDKGGAGYLIDRRSVEAWVSEAVAIGVAAAGSQLVLDVDA